MVIHSNIRNDDVHEKEMKYIQMLKRMGLELFSFRSNLANQNAIYVLIRAPLDLIRAHADEIDFPMLLDPIAVSQAAQEGDEGNHIAPFEIRHDPIE